MEKNYRSYTLKYRPQTFKDIVGQNAVATALSNAVKAGKIHPAYLFNGPRGSGKTSLARIFAASLNCSKGGQEPCNKCSSCVEISASRSLDVLEIDAASHTGVDHVREVIIDTLNLTPTRDKWRIFIIDEVHMLSNSAFNAMLKTLEEPPPHIVFIMATTEYHKVPSTIVSRTQNFPFRAIPQALVCARLENITTKEKIQIEKKALEQISSHAHGSLRDAISMLEQLICLTPDGEKASAARLADILGSVKKDLLEGLIRAILKDADIKTASQIIQKAIYDAGYPPQHLLAALYNKCCQDMLASMTDANTVLMANRLYDFSKHILELYRDIRFAPEPLLFFEVGILSYLIKTPAASAQPPAAPAPAPQHTQKIEQKYPACAPANKVPAESPVKKNEKTEDRQAQGMKIGSFQEFLGAVEKEGLSIYFADSELDEKTSAGKSVSVIKFANTFQLMGAEKYRPQIIKIWTSHFGEKPVEFGLNESKSPAAYKNPEPIPHEQPEEASDEIKEIADIFGGKIKRQE
ncbi:DNA polymerase III subunit gamma/tau [Elusimicrobiota bacterium]